MSSLTAWAYEGTVHLCKPSVGKRGTLTMFLNATPRCLPFFLQNQNEQPSAS